jgi:hypothetical protein
LPLAAALSFATLTAAQAAPLSRDADHVFRPTGRRQGEVDEEATQRQREDRAAGRAAAGLSTVKGAGINYHGGPVMNGLTKVYLLYYGAWTATQTGTMNSFMQTLGGTPIYKTHTGYYSLACTVKSPVVNSVTLMASHTDNYSLGKTLSDANIKTLVTKAITAGWFPKYSNAVYFVLTAPDVKMRRRPGVAVDQEHGRHPRRPVAPVGPGAQFAGQAAGHFLFARGLGAVPVGSPGRPGRPAAGQGQQKRQQKRQAVVDKGAVAGGHARHRRRDRSRQNPTRHVRRTVRGSPGCTTRSLTGAGSPASRVA